MNKIWAIMTLATVLAGCSVNPTFNHKTEGPRPFTTESSEASKLLAQFDGAGLNNTAIICAIDRAIWEDEVGLDRGGFNALDVYRASKREKTAKAMVEEYGTIPVVLQDRVQTPRDPDKPGVGSILSSSIALNRNWGSLGQVGLGLGMGTLFTWVSSPKTGEDILREKDEISIRALWNTWFMFPLSNARITSLKGLDKTEACRWEFSNECQAHRDTVAPKLAAEVRQDAFELFSQAALNLGFKPIGEPGQTTYKNGVKAIYQMLENDTLKCPKIEPGKFSMDYCRVTFRENDGTKVNLDGAKGAVLIKQRAHVGLVTPCVTDKVTQMNLQDELIRELIKLSPKSMVYVASDKINGTWTPQKVVDHRGEHFFVVPVRRNCE